MRIDILTIFPRFFDSPFEQSLIAKSREKGLLDIHVWDIRDFAQDRHRTVDDVPYGGGAGMIMKIEPLVACLRAVETASGRGYRILLSPQGAVFSQARARQLSAFDHLVLICGRYEGVDYRINQYIDAEMSVGDYVVMGGESPALVVIEAVSRLVAGVVGSPDSVSDESFSDGLLEYPAFTRPAEFENHAVPDVLLSGDHGRIRQWRLRESLRRTRRMRPDLLEGVKFDGVRKKLLDEIQKDDA